MTWYTPDCQTFDAYQASGGYERRTKIQSPPVERVPKAGATPGSTDGRVPKKAAKTVLTRIFEEKAEKLITRAIEKAVRKEIENLKKALGDDLDG